ncbi:hypothetical protein BDE36_4377 [Arcticibacter tournemirensis]|uniref:Uncharacterized protein n=1 Tax=Arcticibacter tournemirensis TaxID=699437 RepID=A0A5M9H6U4_9SPHI|nr:hypothetical protein [Arcticibacter tournemirensis]KAA8482586.1 hypothetical protein F1649_11455 [Arcticibacter tournemirensis]TQM52556.1 hypothetical protein BDE36_4377 [Arcticibacter tournemirensis]
MKRRCILILPVFFMSSFVFAQNRIHLRKFNDSTAHSPLKALVPDHSAVSNRSPLFTPKIIDDIRSGKISVIKPAVKNSDGKMSEARQKTGQLSKPISANTQTDSSFFRKIYKSEMLKAKAFKWYKPETDN